MRKFTLLVFLSVIFTGLTFAQESLLKAKSKHQAKETHTTLIDNATNRVNLEVLNKTEKNSSFYEGFENSPDPGNGALPQGWTQKRTATLDASPVTNPAPGTATWFRHEPGVYGFETGNYVYSGNASMAIGYTAPDFTWAISPEFTITGNEGDMVFLTYFKWYVNDGASGVWPTNYHVKILVNGTWHLVQSFIANAETPNNTWQEIIGLDISAYLGETAQIAFIYEYTDGYQMAIDQIDVFTVQDYDNSIASVAYQWYQWWPVSSGKELNFDVYVNGLGLAPGLGSISMFVNDQEIATEALKFMLFGMSDTIEFNWTPNAPGMYDVRFQLGDEMDDGGGTMVPDENPANNILELTFDVPDPETVLFVEGFEHVDWDNPEGASAIFPPSAEWLYTEPWNASVDLAMRDLISAAVNQKNDSEQAIMVTPGMTIPAGDIKIEMIVGGLNNGILDEEAIYYGHSTLQVYLLDAQPTKDLSEEMLLLTYELDSLVGDTERMVTIYATIETEGTYYLQFVTTSSFIDIPNPNGGFYYSWVILDNLMVTLPVMYDITFNVDVTDLEGFDPATHNIYMTGTPTNWAVPGTEGSVTMTRDASVTESVIYTTTVSIEEGSAVEYKYFSDLVGEGFQGGEWDGEPNRKVTITEAVTIDDIWAFYEGVSVEEVTEVQVLTVYPNPVRENLTIVNDENISSVRIFDITGRVVFNANVNDVTTVINVSDLNEGVYVVQIISGNEVYSRKINIVK